MFLKSSKIKAKKIINHVPSMFDSTQFGLCPTISRRGLLVTARNAGESCLGQYVQIVTALSPHQDWRILNWRLLRQRVKIKEAHSEITRGSERTILRWAFGEGSEEDCFKTFQARSLRSYVFSSSRVSPSRSCHSRPICSLKQNIYVLQTLLDPSL